MVGVCQRRPVPGLDTLLGRPVAYLPFADREKLTALAVWGRDASPATAVRLAARRGLPWFRVSHGFVRPLGQGGNQAPLSVVIDDERTGDDIRAPSRLERLIGDPHDKSQRQRARKLIELWRGGRLSCRNDARDESERLPSEYVLVVAEPPHTLSMVAVAAAEHPESIILTWMQRDDGWFHSRPSRQKPRFRMVSGAMHPATVLERARAVYTAGSSLGFEAMLLGRPVNTFGAPFYAGWGLTTDHSPTASRSRSAELEDVVYAALVAGSRYRHPETGRNCEPEDIFEWLALQRRMRARFPTTLYATGFSFRKRRIVREFLQGSRVRFVRRAEQTPPGAPLVRWGRRPEETADAQRMVIRLEDGFLRSVGLGAGLVRPLSWVLDRQGIHYDATRPSELEHLLQTMTFDADLLARARRLAVAIIAGGVTKYNLGATPWRRPAGVRKVILVPGQVETDASLRYGAPGIGTNLGLLQAVRAANPEAYVVYKPHPDVLAGLRAHGQGENEARAWCDEQVDAAPMGQLLLDVDEVHVLTSLAGFEALLRGKAVTCYGQPFFAGWGLTTDVIPIARRTRRLSLDALLAAVLIVYPTYISRVTGHFTTPERVLEELQQWRVESGQNRPGAMRRFAQPLFHAFLRWMNDPSPKKWADGNESIRKNAPGDSVE